jgi:hypothetical protein
MDKNRYNASWWSKEHDSAWENVKDAFRRDWTQTKHDFGGNAPDLNQDVDDTVKQAAGKQAIPPSNVPNFEEHEAALRFGYGASRHYGKRYPKWDDKLEATLRKEWAATDDLSWNRYAKSVRRGYEYKGPATSR